MTVLRDKFEHTRKLTFIESTRTYNVSLPLETIDEHIDELIAELNSITGVRYIECIGMFITFSIMSKYNDGCIFGMIRTVLNKIIIKYS